MNRCMRLSGPWWEKKIITPSARARLNWIEACVVDSTCCWIFRHVGHLGREQLTAPVSAIDQWLFPHSGVRYQQRMRSLEIPSVYTSIYNWSNSHSLRATKQAKQIRLRLAGASTVLGRNVSGPGLCVSLKHQKGFDKRLLFCSSPCALS
jgi:hypothetical protein